MTTLFFMLSPVCSFFGTGNHPGQLSGICITIMITAALVCFVVGEITSNYSQVDKLWSLMPVIYSLIALIYSPNPRLLIMCILVTTWGIRLSYNLHRKGGYNIVPWKGEEDYRWKIMRQQPLLKGRIRFGMFNLFFISFYQHMVIFLFCSPLLLAAKYRDQGLTPFDILIAFLILVFLVIETIADNQQFRFQKLKKQNKPSGGLFAESLKKGFLSEGLWRFVRHPNFVSEQAIWICFYFFGVAASGKWINWTLAGPALLVLLFMGSTALTENISSKKYPGYEAYRNNVPKFFLRLFSSHKQ